MTIRSIPKEFRPLVLQAIADGWRLDTSHRHPRLLGPDGQIVVMSATPSDRREVHNLAARLRRATRAGAR